MNIIDANINMNNGLDVLPRGIGRIQRRILSCVFPPILALVAVWNESALTTLSQTHEAMLPLAILLLLAALLHHSLRQFLVVTLCYGVAFLALRDTSRVMLAPLPTALNYDWVDVLRPIGLWLVAGLAAVAGIAESVKPGTVWARRCYFGAAALYFTGVGVMNTAANHSWRGVVLCIAGVTAFVGCILAHQIVAIEIESDDEMPSDELVQQAREAAHRAALQTKEWHGNLLSIIDEYDSPVASATIEVAPRT